MKAVLDTNVLVSAAIHPKGKPRQILMLASSEFEWLISGDILAELTDVLSRKHIQTKYGQSVTPSQQKEFFKTAGEITQVVKILSTPNAVTADSDDNAILACAVDGQADFLVTGDPHLLKLKSYSGIKIITPAIFLQILTKD